MRPETRDALVHALSRYDSLVEIGIGRRPDVAAALASTGRRVVATDLRRRPVPADVTFVLDDVLDPTIDLYADAEAIYALNLPPELHRPAWTLARRVGAAFHFTTLGTETPAVPAVSTRAHRDRLFTAVAGPVARSPASPSKPGSSDR